MSKVQIVRFWLLVAAAFVSSWCARDPMWSLVPVLFFPGQASCFCCGVVCLGCSPDHTGQMQVDVAGMANGVCNNCTAYNATWVLSRTTIECDTGGSVGNACYWSFASGSPSICANLGLASGVCIETYTTGTDLWGVLKRAVAAGSNATFTDTTDTYDCTAFAAHSIPFASVGNGCGGTPTFEITSLP